MRGSIFSSLNPLEFGVGEEEGFGALVIEIDLDLIVLGDLVAIDTHDRSFAKDTMGDPVGRFEGRRQNW